MTGSSGPGPLPWIIPRLGRILRRPVARGWREEENRLDDEARLDRSDAGPSPLDVAARRDRALNLRGLLQELEEPRLLVLD